MNEVFRSFKKLADKKKEVFDDDLIALVEDQTREKKMAYQLLSVKVTTGTDTVPQAAVKIKYKKKTFEAKSTGDGPVDACYKAVDKITSLSGRLLDYRIEAVTSGKDAMGEASIKVSIKNKVISGRGSSTDIIEASVLAYLNAVNKYAL
ncbi:MAG: hypothetical protein H8D90_00160 [Candidatus Omnitrophica bacterium]|nr:hypothetical protein [Candidatus Omnitrophota bacterium]